MAYQARPIKINLGSTDFDEAGGRTTVLYGDSGNGKTTQLAELAEHYFWPKHKKPVRLISSEDSSKTIFKPLIKAGIVKPLFISKIDDPVSVWRKLSRGEWPTTAGGLEPWDQSACAYLIEGLSSAAEQMQEDNREKGRFLGEHAEKNNHIENDERLALPGQFSYNFVQMEMVRLMRSFAMLPGIERVVWTAHEYKGNEDGTGKALRGPALVGQKGTGAVSKYCGMLLHLDVVGDKSGAVERRIYLSPHADPNNPLNTNPAKLTVPLKAREQFFKLLGTTEKQGYVVSNFANGTLTKSLVDVFKAEDTVTDQIATAYINSAFPAVISGPTA